MENNLLSRIEMNSKIMVGKPVIKGTRITVELILEKLGNGETEAQILNSYPVLKKEDIQAAILFASKRLSLEEIADIE